MARAQKDELLNEVLNEPPFNIPDKEWVDPPPAMEKMYPQCISVFLGPSLGRRTYKCIPGHALRREPARDQRSETSDRIFTCEKHEDIEVRLSVSIIAYITFRCSLSL